MPCVCYGHWGTRAERNGKVLPLSAGRLRKGLFAKADNKGENGLQLLLAQAGKPVINI